MDWYQIATNNIRHKDNQTFVEMDVQRLIIEPLLQWLGYDTFDFNMVREQTRISHSGQKAGQGRADYTIYHENKLLMILEAKMLSESLDDGAKIKQLLDYCNYHGGRPRWGILTNGKHWHIYDSHASGNAPDRRILQIDITQADHVLPCLKKENLSHLAQYADTIRGLSGVPKETKITILPLLLSQFSKEIGQSKVTTPKNTSTHSNLRKKKSKGVALARYDQNPLSGKKPTALHLDGKKISVQHWSEVLLYTSKYILKQCEDIADFDAWSPGTGQIRVSKNKQVLRKPKSISSTHFIESNISSKDIIRTLNAMIDTANLSKDCYWVE